MITDKDFAEWLQHPVTIAVKDYCASKREGLRDTWESGALSAAFETEMLVKNAGATGACSIYKELMELDFEQLIGELDDGEQLGAPALGGSGAD